jgi:hypothetical protein
VKGVPGAVQLEVPTVGPKVQRRFRGKMQHNACNNQKCIRAGARKEARGGLGG